MGSGAAILTVAKLAGVTRHGHGHQSDGCTCARSADALWWGVKCKVHEGDLFENVPKSEFDLVFWNQPS